MRFTLQYPISQSGYDTSLLEPEGMRRFVQATEAAGFDAIAFTDHPAPSAKWLAGGGHESFDPLTALAFCAAVSDRLKLMTALLVLPYRNPLLVGKQIATVDRISGGRLVLAVGSGYLRSEFAALGVPFEERGALMDEALDVLDRLWAPEPFSHQGAHFTAVGQTSQPLPVQLPRPPIWFGGNGQKSRRRAAERGQGWAPMLGDEVLAATSRTTALTLADLGPAIAEVRQWAVEFGRQPSDVQIQVSVAPSTLLDPQAAREGVASLAASGVDWVLLEPPAMDLEKTLDAVGSYGAEVIAPGRAVSAAGTE